MDDVTRANNTFTDNNPQPNCAIHRPLNVHPAGTPSLPLLASLSFLFDPKCGTARRSWLQSDYKLETFFNANPILQDYIANSYNHTRMLYLNMVFIKYYEEIFIGFIWLNVVKTGRLWPHLR